MKKLLLIVIVLISFSVKGQDKTLNLLPGLDGAYVTFFGTTADTINNTSAKSYVFLINSPWTFDACYQIVSVKTSGYTKFKYTVTESLDGITYHAITNIPVDSCKTGQVTTLKKTGHLSAVISGRWLKFTVTGIDSTQRERIYGYLKLTRKYRLP